MDCAMVRRPGREKVLLLSAVILILLGIIGIAWQAAWLESVVNASGSGEQTGTTSCGSSGTQFCFQGAGPSDWARAILIVALSLVAAVIGLLVLRALRRVPPAPASTNPNERPGSLSR
ncbi:MAG: hypothetical protein L3K10_02485 [Thermoplasmata archaeon]|jgi:hypothetical protein|nr:hypothetical protein [Thermoplasmata archaeon]